MRRLLAALGLEGLLLAVRTLSVTRLRFRLSAPSLHPKSEEFFSLSLLDFSNAFPKLPEDEKTSSAPLWGSTSSFISSFISSSMTTFPVEETAAVHWKPTVVASAGGWSGHDCFRFSLPTQASASIMRRHPSGDCL